jgi:DNA-3-methyladenine glycosylase I
MARDPDFKLRTATRHEDGRRRCAWCSTDADYVRYHDTEWGVPLRDDRALFELLCLEGAQAGLSWLTILRKRETYRLAFDGFDPAKMARYDARRRAKLLTDPGIVRNRLKVEAFVANARAWLDVQERDGSFAEFVWAFAPTGRRPRPRVIGDIPASTPESDALSRALAKRGFKFVGTTICYAFMQAAGLVDDHQRDCWVVQRS